MMKIIYSNWQEDMNLFQKQEDMSLNYLQKLPSYEQSLLGHRRL
jgi:hypothetical protein